MSEIRTAFNRSLLIIGLIALGLYSFWQGDETTAAVIIGGFLGLLKGSE